MSSPLTKKLTATPELAAIAGKKTLTRAEAVKAVWAYAADNDLKETRKVKDRNTAGIMPDAALAEVFGSRKWHSMGEIASAVSGNLD